jgi:LEA14-like dessication related protein
MNETKLPLALLSAALALLGSCATKPPAAQPEPKAAPTAVLNQTGLRFLARDRAVLSFALALSCPEGQEIASAEAGCELFLANASAGRASAALRSPVAGGGSGEIALELPVDLAGAAAAGSPPEARWSLAAKVEARMSDGRSVTIPAAAEGSVPSIKEPIFRITSLRIERDVLVTTNLRLGLEVENPNAFPLVLEELGYDLYGEKRLWASGESREALSVPAGGRAEEGLRFEMNFADMDRRLFDLVAELKAVSYRLSGEAAIATSLDFLPRFLARFDESGSCAVER